MGNKKTSTDSNRPEIALFKLKLKSILAFY